MRKMRADRFTYFLNATYPSVKEYEISAFEADQRSVRTGTDTPYFTPPLTPKSAVYTMWIGAYQLPSRITAISASWPT